MIVKSLGISHSHNLGQYLASGGETNETSFTTNQRNLIILDPKAELTAIVGKRLGSTKIQVFNPFMTAKQLRLVSPKEVVPEHNRKTHK